MPVPCQMLQKTRDALCILVRPSSHSANHSSQQAKQADANGQYTRRSHVTTESNASRAACAVLRGDVEDEQLEPTVLLRPVSQVKLETVCDR